MDPIQLSTFRAPRGQNAGGRYIASDVQEVEVITAGRGFFDLDGRLVTALRGTVLWHLPGERTIYRNDFRDPYECLVVKFPWPAAKEASVPRPAPRLSVWRDSNECLAFTDELMAYYHGKDPDLELLADYAYGVLRWQAHRGRSGGEEHLSSTPVGRAKAFIEKNFPRELSIADMAESAAISPPHLHALFRREFGMSPHQALLDRRLTEARRLLAGTLLSVKEIAYRTGFAEASVLCKRFKARCGCTPGEYRERHLQKDS